MIQNRIVIDTNVCLDLFVFHDSRWAQLLAALNAGDIEAVTRSDCRTEWLKVLEYRHLPLNDELRPEVIAAFDRLITCLPADFSSVRAEILLPVCTDPDDQKFLELARDAGAATLITKDKALLKLARRTARAGMFQIMQPEKWTASWETMQATPAEPV
ncbi:putative toxin-antitoxin system toxin component, PIN family [Noviherbaspirillum saxi]|uniref:Putative toxin-antitoxin system toxin component, PIN family n=1 Tax=Noviherbaspirillum saxi TaxID=2320863 RepID=A0A3A3FRC1_9BURK|nr:putative toxin-antitoxin system toxin component, PIN family [Noviherbaspirillum saxi]RJF98596.1 putative toxin-antitoxin system toxin component, PIN family [Noviherbaspirillum saxi]